MTANLVCRVCLVDNMNLYSVRNDLQNLYERIAGEKYNQLGYPVHMCYICLTVLRKCHRFMETARDTNNMLKQWYKQQNEIRLARPLYSYSICPVDVGSNELKEENIIVEINEIKSERVELEQEDVQPEYVRCVTDVIIKKFDRDEQTHYSEVLVDNPDGLQTDTVEDNNDRQTDPFIDCKMDLDGTSRLDLNLENIKNTNVIPRDYAIPPLKKHNKKNKPHTSETPEEITANNDTSNDKLSNRTPKPDDITQRDSKTKISIDINNCHIKNTVKSIKVLNPKEIETRNRIKNIVRNILNNRKESNELTIKTDVTQNKINIPTSTTTNTALNNQYICDICNFKCTSKLVIIMHMGAHGDSTPRLCDECGDVFLYLDSLNSHKASKHTIDTTNENLNDAPPSDKTKEPKTRAHISAKLRKKIVRLHNSGCNISEIARETDCCRQTVRLWVKRFEREGSLLCRRSSGRRRCVDQAQVREMIEQYRTNSFIPTRTFAERYNVSMETVRRILRREGLRRKQIKKTKENQSTSTWSYSS